MTNPAPMTFTGPREDLDSDDEVPLVRSVSVPTNVVEALEHDLCEQSLDATQLSSTVPVSSGAVREVHQDGAVPPRTGRRVVLVPASPDATPSSLMSNRFAVLADEEGCEESPRVRRRPSRLVIVSQGSEPTVTQPAAQPLPTWKDSSEEVSHPSVVEAATGEALRRMEHFVRAHTQVDSAEDDSPGAPDVNGAESPEEFDLTRGDDEIENHAPTGEGSSRDGMSEIGAGDVPPVHVEVEPDSMPARIPAIGRAFESLDSIDLREVFARKAVVMKVPPRFLKGAYCSALRMAMLK